MLLNPLVEIFIIVIIFIICECNLFDKELQCLGIGANVRKLWKILSGLLYAGFLLH